MVSLKFVISKSCIIIIFIIFIIESLIYLKFKYSFLIYSSKFPK